MRRHRTLRWVSTAFAVLGWAVIVLGSLGSCALLFGALANPEALLGPELARASPLLAGLGLFVGGLFLTAIEGLTFLGLFGVLRLLIDVEENSRRTVENLERMRISQTPVLMQAEEAPPTEEA